MLICPNCDKPLKKGRRPHGFIWGCQRCGGRAAPLALLRRSIDKNAIDRMWQRVVAIDGVEGKACPICTKRMVQFQLKVVDVDWKLDLCKPCQLFWFDEGEYDDLPGVPPPAPAPDLNIAFTKKAREALAISKLQQIRDHIRDFQIAPEEHWKFIPAVMGVPIEFDSDHLRFWPWVTWVLFLSFVTVFGLTITNLDQAIGSYGFVPQDAFRLGGLTLVTSFFIHGSLFHLIGNAYFLLVFGDNVEDYVGKWLFGLLLLSGTLLGVFIHGLFDPNPEIPTIGASAGVSGVLVFYALQFPRIRMGIVIYWRWFRIPVTALLALWAALQVVLAYYQLTGVTNVSALAHIGGALAGLTFWYSLNQWYKKPPKKNESYTR